MQARFAAFSALALALVASPTFAQTAACPETEHDRHIFVNNATEPQAIGSANGGVWKTTDGGASADLDGAPSNLTTTPAEGSTDYLLRIEGVEGDSGGAPAQSRVQAQGQRAGLIVPAVQPDRGQRAHDEGDAVVPEMPICAHCGADAAEQPAPAAQQPAQRRGGFVLTIGGVTIGSGGVNVAVGDVNGDGRESGRAHSPVRPVRERPR